MAMVRIMWTFELPADEVLLCLQLMIHKPGKGWSKRGDFRPITLCNDLYRCLDACIFYFVARQTGIIQEPAPDRDTVEESYLSESQRAYQRKRSGLDCLLVTTLTKLRAKACEFILLRVGGVPPAGTSDGGAQVRDTLGQGQRTLRRRRQQCGRRGGRVGAERRYKGRKGHRGTHAAATDGWWDRRRWLTAGYYHDLTKQL